MELVGWVYRYNGNNYVLDRIGDINKETDLASLVEGSSPIAVAVVLPKEHQPSQKIVLDSLSQAYEKIFRGMPLIKPVVQ